MNIGLKTFIFLSFTIYLFIYLFYSLQNNILFIVVWVFLEQKGIFQIVLEVLLTIRFGSSSGESNSLLKLVSEIWLCASLKCIAFCACTGHLLVLLEASVLYTALLLLLHQMIPSLSELLF